MQAFWQQDVAELEATLRTQREIGLSSPDAAERLAKHGPNQLTEAEGPGPLAMFLAQFKDVMIWVLIGAAVVSGFMGEWVDSLAIVGIVMLNAILGFIQEYRAEKSLAALRKLSSPTCKVVRDGALRPLPVGELVPGDVVELEAGDHVPADGRVVSHTANFAVQEASLTGESAPVTKAGGTIPAADPPLGDRTNMVFMGTAVVSGRGRAVVVLTGMETQLGHIAGMIQGIPSEATPLQRKLDAFGKLIVKVCFVLVIAVFLLQWLRGGGVMDVFLTAVSLAVAAIPEGLPAVVSIALALGVHRMVKRNVLIRKLPSVESLGCATVICSDKTGTLTRNEMTVRAVWAGGHLFRVTGTGYEPKGEFQMEGVRIDPADHADFSACLRAGALCNGAHLVRENNGTFRIVGDPTEGSLLTLAAKGGLDKGRLEQDFPLAEELPFDSDRKMMSMLRQVPGGRWTVFVKGAPDILLARCNRLAVAGQTRPLTDADRAQISQVNADLAGEAMRLLAVAWREFDTRPAGVTTDVLECDLLFGGLIAMIDPPREEAKEAVRKCSAAGIRTVMITGDHKNTAVAIGKALGLYRADSRALTGDDLQKMNEQELDRQVGAVAVYARVSPEHKLRIVRAWRKRGDVVAMTGDGVNDAPAVKEADIGVSMGITGTDVTKEVSDMVVTDDNFASIVAAVEEGRGIYDNILKFVHYLLSCNAGEILVMFLAALAGMPVPLLPIHILWVNLVTDGLPALALGVDPVSPGIMRRPPRDPAAPVVGLREGLVLVVQGLLMAVCTLTAFQWVRRCGSGDLEHARTAAFAVLALSQLFHAFNCRSRRESVFTVGVFSNRVLLAAVAVSAALQVLAIQTDGVHRLFRTVDLAAGEWGLVVLLASLPLWGMELVKFGVRLYTKRG